MKIKYLIPVIIICVISFSCLKSETLVIKYREKNPVRELNIENASGNLDIIGWSKNFIEITGNKKLFSGINSDLKGMEIKFDYKNNDFYITTKIPARINGKIDLLINVPYSLLKINIDTGDSNVNIEKYLGNLDIKNKKGWLTFDFYGNFLRVNAVNSIIDFNLLGDNSLDASVNNDEGNTTCDLINCSNDSYLDINTNKGIINLNIAKSIAHVISSFSKKYMLNIDYNVTNKIYASYSYNFFKASYGKSKNPVKINLTNLNGFTIIHKIQ